MSLRCKIILKAKQTNKQTNNQDLWSNLSHTKEQGHTWSPVIKSKYYMDFLDVIKDCKSYWMIVKAAAHSQASQPTNTGNQETRWEIRNFWSWDSASSSFTFLHCRGRVVKWPPACSQEHRCTHVTRVMSHAGITDSLKQLKSAKACGRLAPKLLKHASVFKCLSTFGVKWPQALADFRLKHASEVTWWRDAGRTHEFELSTLKLVNLIFSTDDDLLSSINVLYECENQIWNLTNV